MRDLGNILLGIALGIALTVGWFHVKSIEEQSYEIRAALDIGSGTTNMKIAKVDKETDRVIQIIFEKTVAVPYSKHLEISNNNTFDKQVMDEGIKSIKYLRDIAKDHQAKKVVAVATAAFRKAQNSPELVKLIKQETGVEVSVIEQAKEGILAFFAAVSKTNVDPREAVVWDIGGGSLQLTMQGEDGKFAIYEGLIASQPYKNYIIETIQGKNYQTVHSPNPMTVEEMDKAIAYAAQVAQEVSPQLKEKIKHHDTRVLAVGNLFNLGIKKLMDNESVVVREHLEERLKSMAGYDDAKINEGPMSEVVLSNALLVLGYMKALDIEQITIVNVNNADGALIDMDFWK